MLKWRRRFRRSIGRARDQVGGNSIRPFIAVFTNVRRVSCRLTLDLDALSFASLSDPYLSLASDVRDDGAAFAGLLSAREPWL